MRLQILGASHHREQTLGDIEIRGIGHVEPAQKLCCRHVPGKPALQKHLADRVQALRQACEDVFPDRYSLRFLGCQASGQRISRLSMDPSPSHNSVERS